MQKYQNKYRIASARLRGWDYRNAGAYFITICTHRRQHFFGEINQGKMKLSTMGAIVQGFWYDIPKHFNHVQLGEFVVMPNHLHGVLILSEMDGMGDGLRDGAVETRQCHVSTTTTTDTDFYKNITPKSGSVSIIIGSFKSVCTKHIRQSFPDMNFKWQERFHDHIIRNEKSFLNISNYIIDNPMRWEQDKFFKTSP